MARDRMASLTLVGLMAFLGKQTFDTYKSNVLLDSFNLASDIEYVIDDPNISDGDYWQTPGETEVRGKGDCEDSAFYLHHLLRRKGVRSRVCFGVPNIFIRGGHAWVETEHKGKRYILDPSRGVMAPKIHPIEYMEFQNYFQNPEVRKRRDNYLRRKKAEDNQRWAACCMRFLHGLVE